MAGTSSGPMKSWQCSRREGEEDLLGDADAGAAEPARVLPGGILDRPLRADELGVQASRLVAVHPRFVEERVVADLVSGTPDGSQHIAMFRQGCVLTDDEPGDRLVALVQEPQYPRHD